LPWLQSTVADPFATERTANHMITPSLKPDACPSRMPSPDHKLDFVEVVTMSLCHNPSTKAAYLSLLAQASTYGTNYSAYFPTVAASVNNSRTTSFIRNDITATSTVVSAVNKSYHLAA